MRIIQLLLQMHSGCRCRNTFLAGVQEREMISPMSGMIQRKHWSLKLAGPNFNNPDSSSRERPFVFLVLNGGARIKSGAMCYRSATCNRDKSSCRVLATSVVGAMVTKAWRVQLGRTWEG